MKKSKQVISLIISCILVCMMILPPIAETNIIFAIEEETIIYLDTPESVIELEKNCVYDIFADNKTVILKNDIDMRGYPFERIAMFGGIFEGNGYTISGISSTTIGSDKGFFGTIRENGIVRNLTVEGVVKPTGSKEHVGGIAGINQGRIENCVFRGNIEGNQAVGGIAGINEETGRIIQSVNYAKIKGENYTGGIAGENIGSILECRNYGTVNEEENSSAENTGGIAGISHGRIEDSQNFALVGYKHTGYNVGGIVGRQNGHVVRCTNYGEIYGRKDIGGVVGQLEPYTTVVYEEDLIQEMERKVNDLVDRLNVVLDEAEVALDNITDTADNINGKVNELSEEATETLDLINTEISTLSREAQDTIANLNQKVNDISSQLDSTISRINQIIDDAKDMEEDLNDIMSDARNLVSRVDKIVDNVEDIVKSIRGRVDEVLKQLDEIKKKVEDFANKIKDKVDSVLPDIVTGGAVDITEREEALDKIPVRGVSTQMVSAPSAVEDVLKQQDVVTVSDSNDNNYETSLVSACNNRGSINGDINVGGIVGIVAQEITSDPERDIDFIGEISLKSTSYIKANIEDSRNDGEILAKTSYSGGIAGRADMGTISNCFNTGAVETTNGSYTGGITGFSKGLITSSYVVCDLIGTNDIGGIAGVGMDIEACYSMVRITSDGERIGAIAGSVEGDYFRNFFVKETLEGINGINYDGKAMPIPYEEFITEHEVPDEFKQLKVTFVIEGEIVKELSVPYQGEIKAEEYPEIPEKEGMYAEWEEFDSQSVMRDCIVHAEYHEWKKTISSGGGQPLLLAEGSFYPDSVIVIKGIEYTGELPYGYQVKKAYEYSISSEKENQNEALKLRVYTDADEKRIKIGILNEETMALVSCEKDGSYYTFYMEHPGQFIILEKEANDPRWGIIGGGAFILLLSCVSIAIKKQKSKTTGTKEDTNSSNEEQL